MARFKVQELNLSQPPPPLFFFLPLKASHYFALPLFLFFCLFVCFLSLEASVQSGPFVQSVCVCAWPPATHSFWASSFSPPVNWRLRILPKFVILRLICLLREVRRFGAGAGERRTLDEVCCSRLRLAVVHLLPPLLRTMSPLWRVVSLVILQKCNGISNFASLMKFYTCYHAQQL